MESQSTIKPITGAERIRALTDIDEKFEAFDSYPWKKDQTFMFGLKSILGPPPSSPNHNNTTKSTILSSSSSSVTSTTSTTTPQPVASPQDMAIRARLFYYSQRIGVTLSFDDYKAWLHDRRITNPTLSYQPPDILPEEYKPLPPPLLSWQSSAPKTPLYVSKTTIARRRPDGEDGQDEEQDGEEEEEDQEEEKQDENAPYPHSFTAIVELIASGKPVPGIREIPNTVVHHPNITPFGTMALPRKPWEKE